MNAVRRYWVDTMLKIALPVLDALSRDSLAEEMSIEGKNPREEIVKHTYLEALGRTLTGLAPWLETPALDEEEEARRQSCAEMARGSIHCAVTPGCRDYMNFEEGMQPIVDAAFLSHAVLRAPTELWKKLPEEDKRNLVAQMKRTRTRKPIMNNWLLFSAIIEAFLLFTGEKDWDPMRIDFAVRQHFAWYKGDGFFGDGPDFHMDYYNSYVIQPMLIDILRTVKGQDRTWDGMLERAERYGAHYATFLEHMIMPDGSYPVLGRSNVYRFGAFQMLAQAALQGILEEGVAPEQVRRALTAVIRRIMAFDNFDEKGYLRIGVCGSQPDMGEGYISTGSLYLCTAVFLPLGLHEAHPFWAGEDLPFTMEKMWRGESMRCEHALHD